MKKFFRAIVDSIGFMTVIPTPTHDEWSEEDFGYSEYFYPLAGLIVGGLAGLTYTLLQPVQGSNLAAILALIVWIVIDGALHWDGVANCCDGFFYSTTPEKRLNIMRDSRVGTYGTVGLILGILLKILLIINLPVEGALFLFIFASVSARWFQIVLLYMPLARPTGLAATMKAARPKLLLVVSFIFPLAAGILVGWKALIYFAAGLVVTGLIALLAKSKIKGVSGDVLGLTVEMTELVILLTAVLVK